MVRQDYDVVDYSQPPRSGTGRCEFPEEPTNGDVMYENSSERDKLSPVPVPDVRIDTPLQFRRSPSKRSPCCGLSLCGKIVLAVLVVIVLALSGCVVWLSLEYFGRRTLDVDRTCMEPECLRASAMLRGSVNTSVSPCGGVWEFSCGKWLLNNPIPPTKSRWGVFDKLRYQATEEYRSIVNTLPQPLEADQLPWKLKHFYDSCMDLDNINIDKASQLLLEIKQFGEVDKKRTNNKKKGQEETENVLSIVMLTHAQNCVRNRESPAAAVGRSVGRRRRCRSFIPSSDFIIEQPESQIIRRQNENLSPENDPDAE
ncbi:unnamed protein product [Notodromas monacha]|uniref:Peptidase M13 N-terminal domain-containing protein n=1 Tax=Notodromas monacha TaxID=399045 RepID=A0A7R9GC67_9CRUS|nr:unnamed protein product [Notodromas monacha]CAG0915793.1 unnamed protein product [Notodromas monacha]